MAKSYLYPFPVYEALLSNGEEVRLSFWSPANRPIDMEAGRRAIMATSAALSDKTQWVKEADGWHNRYIPQAEIICGYVEHASIGRVEDKLESAPQRRKAVNWRKALADIRTSLAAGKADFALSQLDAILAA